MTPLAGKMKLTGGDIDTADGSETNILMDADLGKGC